MNPSSPGDLHLVIHQTAPVLRHVDRNQAEIRDRVLDSRQGDLLVFPELATSGYSLRAQAGRFAVSLEEPPPLRLPPGSPPVALGLPERGRDELVYNAAVVVHEDRVLAKHRKIYLPTYGLFDEGRYFASGKRPPLVTSLPSGWRVGLLICEDFWHPSLIYLLAMQRVEVVLVLAAAPGRGQPLTPGQDQPLTPGQSQPLTPEQSQPLTPEQSQPLAPAPWSLFASQANWNLLAQAAAMQYGVYVVIANRAGVEEGVTFAGESLVVAPDGGIVARAPQAEPAVLEASLEHQAIRRARSPFAHLRDEDPHFLRRALDLALDDR